MEWRSSSGWCLSAGQVHWKLQCDTYRTLNTPAIHFLPHTNNRSDENLHTFCVKNFTTSAIGFHKMHGRCVKNEHSVQALPHLNLQCSSASWRALRALHWLPFVERRPVYMREADCVLCEKTFNFRPKSRK